MNSLDAHTWLADHGDYLFRVARRQLHSDELAEDAVQETLLAALSAQELGQPETPILNLYGSS